MEVNNSGFWDIAYRENAPALLGVLRRYVREVSVAQDLLHEVFVAAIDKYDDYTGKGSFEGWLYRIAVNTALMYLRNERNRQVPAEAVLSVIDDHMDDDQIDDARTVIEAAGFSDEELLAAIDRLPEHHKLVFNMYVMDDFSHKRIAAELNISPGTSKSHLARARKKIQQFLYEDAMNRTKKRDRRRASAFLLLFPARRHYIDKLYRDGLADFKIQPTDFHYSKIQGFQDSKIQGFQNSKIQSEHLELLNQKSGIMESGILESLNHGIIESFWGSKLSYMVACCGTAAITGTVCWMAMGDNSPLNRDNDWPNRQEIMIPVGDSLIYLPSIMEADADNFMFDVVSGNSFHSVDAVPEHEPVPVPEPEIESVSEPVSESVSSNEPVESDGSATKTEPVVITRQIIQHQTVVVRDTIFIIEDE